MSERTNSAATPAQRFVCIVARAPDLAAAERALAEAVSAGATGAEQREAESGGGLEGAVTLLLYAPAPLAAPVARALVGVLGAEAVAAAVPVEPRDWSEAWKVGLRPIEVSPRLRLRPSFDTSAPTPGQRELVIDPGQAFGTGGHESTRLALDWLDALRGELGAECRLLDVGTGSGVLALAALSLGSGRALGLDLDPLAAPAAREHAQRNGLAARFAVFTGPLEALAARERFAGIVAILLRREIEPLLPELAARLRPQGFLVASGLLAAELAGFERRAAGVGLEPAGSRHAVDASGAGWVASLMRPRPANR